MSHTSQGESRSSTYARASAFMNEIEKYDAESNILVVTHGAFMNVLTRELSHRGYKGKSLIRPRNGAIYIYEKE
ncbi:hypothetical protein GCM10008915_39250 [Bifidobacterium pullorum subsp. gallinarum]